MRLKDDPIVRRNYFRLQNEGNELCKKKCVCFICILLYCNRLCFLTVATFPATYIQQLARSLQKNERLVTVCLARSNFPPIHLSQRNTPAYGTHHLCVAILTTKHILTQKRSGRLFPRRL
jgi:superfamily II DNA/RNA helicase